MVDIALLKKLREDSGAGVTDCKEALEEAAGDLGKAKEILRKKSISDKKRARATGEGLIGSYIHTNGKLGVIVEVKCETDFVARNENFQELARDIAMHIAGTPHPPVATSREDVDAELVEKEKEVYAEQMRAQGKPENIIDKIVQGKLEKFYKENVLLEQPFVKDQDITIKELVDRAIRTVGENIVVGRFHRLELGEEQDEE